MAIFCAACTALSGYGSVNRAAQFTGAGGGTATNAGAIPAPTVTAKAVHAASMADAADGRAKAAASCACSVAWAAATVVLGGTTGAKYEPMELAHLAAQSAIVEPGSENVEVSELSRAETMSSMVEMAGRAASLPNGQRSPGRPVIVESTRVTPSFGSTRSPRPRSLTYRFSGETVSVKRCWVLGSSVW